MFCFAFSDTQSSESKRKIPSQTTASQTSPTTSKAVTVDDLTTDAVGEAYWEVLAEKRRNALEETLVENQELYERIAVLEDELNQSKSLLAETRNLVEVLTEMLEEKDGEESTGTEAPAPKTDDPANDEDISD